MFYIVEIEDYIRVEPKLFGLETRDAVEKQLNIIYKAYHDKELGSVMAVLDVLNVGEGIIIPGDGAAYYCSKFKLLVWKPELQELVFCTISSIESFGAFMNLGSIEGMMHISQAMDDYVSFSKSSTLTGKNSKKSLRKGDACLARIVALSYKAGEPKIGLTMRQPGLGKLDWIQDEKRKQKQAAKVAEKAAEKAGSAEKAKTKSEAKTKAKKK